MIVPITMPGVNLSAFVNIVGKIKVNTIDAKQIRPVAKFSDLVDNLLIEGCAEQHIYQSFYVELPAPVESYFRNFKHYGKFSISVANETHAFIGVISGSFSLWKEFIQWLKADDSLNAYRTAFEAYFAKV